MGRNLVRAFGVTAILFAWPLVSYAQDAAIRGTAKDSSGGILPGVTVTAKLQATGNTFVEVTDDRGQYRIPLRTGVYSVSAELPGFATVERVGLEILVGQQLLVDFEMKPASLQETVTVTGDAPLLDVTQSKLGSNITSQQVAELPLNGRNFMDLTLLAAGSRANAVVSAPETTLSTQNYGFQINIDGQQVTLQAAPTNWGQPQFSRDAIAEFEVVTKRFDATQGRSSGIQVNVVTKSGQNTPSGSFGGYFRSDRFVAKDFIQHRVLPYSDQQLSGTFGGPIVRDRAHFFVSVEGEREPQTATFTTPFPAFNVDLDGVRTEKKLLVRGDLQASPKLHLTVRGDYWHNNQPYATSNGDPPGGGNHPSAMVAFNRYSNNWFAALTQIVNSSVVNEVRGGHNVYYWTDDQRFMKWPDSILNGHSELKTVRHVPDLNGTGAPGISFQGFTVNNLDSTALDQGQRVYSVRDDLTYVFNATGHHSVRLGGEYLQALGQATWCGCMDAIDAQGGPVPANITQLLPVWNDVSTWNLNALAPIVRFNTVTIGGWSTESTRKNTAAWAQDDWTPTSRLTLNLGVRYDQQLGATGANAVVPDIPWMKNVRSDNTGVLQPRLGFSYGVNDKTVIRGGYGLYYSAIHFNVQFYSLRNNIQHKITVPNDGRPDFVTNPFNGPRPTFAQLSQLPYSALRFDYSQIPQDGLVLPRSGQTSIGVERQIGNVMSVEADYVYQRTDKEFVTRNLNLTYDRATGLNYPFNDVTHLVYPNLGIISAHTNQGYTRYHALQTAFTKRLRNRWSGSATYTLGGLWTGTLSPAPFPVAPDLGGEYTLGVGDQRHRATANGIWQLAHGFQLSGLYFFGSGQRAATNFGADLRLVGAGGEGRLRRDGTIVPRNNFVGKPVHRVDMRLLRQFRLIGSARIDGMIEIFNLFNHANYGAYITAESNARYGQPTTFPNVAYTPRLMQLGFRLSF